MKLSKEATQEQIKKAIELVKGIEEPYRTLSFNVILEKLLRSESNKENLTAEIKSVLAPIEIRPDEKAVEAEKNFDYIMSSKFDWSEHSYIYKMEPYVQYLAVLKIALEKFEVDGLTPPEISTILREKFRILKIYNTISMAMAGYTGRYVDRVRKGTGFAYRISRIGLDYVEQNIRQIVGSEPARKAVKEELSGLV